jgi:hypothetical protein
MNIIPQEKTAKIIGRHLHQSRDPLMHLVLAYPLAALGYPQNSEAALQKLSKTVAYCANEYLETHLANWEGQTTSVLIGQETVWITLLVSIAGSPDMLETKLTNEGWKVTNETCTTAISRIVLKSIAVGTE